ncbi:unnamed protein product [Peronospora belbahrii]|uniref:Zinc finger GRF-type domain-containing protein n=1 Tax=Peronospora belbahrii TaxID=622444 RepID=A0ABN8CS43_9STRA|nr:unnamed protein product [Peronospora belbahrii]
MGDASSDAPVGQWARRKEARRNMYATSTEKKCFRSGHWTYECKNEAVYVQRPSRSQQLKNPELRQPFNTDKPPEMEKKKILGMEKDKMRQVKERVKAKNKSRNKRHRRVSSSSSDSSSSVSDSSDSNSSSSSSDSSESESESESFLSSSGSDCSSQRKLRLKRQRRD